MLRFIARLLFKHLARRVATARKPDFVIGDADKPYLLRWYLTPWRDKYKETPASQRTRWQEFVSRLPNVYLHCFMRSDDDRALHDHPWNWCSFLLAGQYTEVTHEPIDFDLSPGGSDYMVVDLEANYMQVARVFSAGALRWHRAEFAHRLMIPERSQTWTLFFCGWRRRRWGFHCPQGWVPWEQFTDPATQGATVGRGCE